MLSYLEYRVGRTHGLSTSVRQELLSRVFSGALPPVFDRAYMDEWGPPSSAQRLRKLAETLAAFCRNAKRRDTDAMRDAIRDWEGDVNFLYEEYYVGYFHFEWPTTQIL
jgi:hypothetical protein